MNIYDFVKTKPLLIGLASSRRLGVVNVVFSLQLPPGCPINKLARTRKRTDRFVHNKKSYRSDI